MPIRNSLLALLLATPAAAQTTTDMPVSPAAGPTPALRYRLTFDGPETHAGNAALFYARAALARRTGEPEPAKVREERDAWLRGPLEEFPADKVRADLDRFRQVFRDLEFAAACRECDWQLDEHLNREGISANLDVVQQCRELAFLLALRIRLAVAEGRTDDALADLRVGFTMARHVATGPTLIVGLVGVALHAIMCERVEELIRQPGSPNLYWALATLPRPFADFRAAMDGELRIQAGLAPPLAELENEILSEEDAARALEVPFRTIDRLSGGSDSAVPDRLALAALAALNYARARDGLIAEGMDRGFVEMMPVAQVVALDSARWYYRSRDDFLKWTHLPPHDAMPRLREAMTHANAEVRDPARRLSGPTAILWTLVMPAADRVYTAFARADRRTALLMAVEAVRMHAAAHDGELPAGPGAVTAVPVPDDPFTGRPFGYARDGRTVTLTAPPVVEGEAGRRDAFRYRITIH